MRSGISCSRDPRKPEPTEVQKTVAKEREELAPVLERLRAPGFPQGIARQRRKQVAILEREIAKLVDAKGNTH